MAISDLQLGVRLYFGLAALAGVDLIQLFST